MSGTNTVLSHGTLSVVTAILTGVYVPSVYLSLRAEVYARRAPITRALFIEVLYA
jgi:hypothetical protein